MQTLTTTDLQRGTAKAVATVLAGESVQIRRNNQTVGYLVPPGAFQAIDLLTVGTIADAHKLPWQEIARRVSELCADPQWGRDNVILVAHPDSRLCVITPVAAWKILASTDKES